MEFELLLTLAARAVKLLGEVTQTHTEALLEVSLDNLESYATATEFLIGIGAVNLLGVEDSHSPRHLVARKVVVADDEVDAVLLGIVDHLHGFDATVEGNDELDTCLACIVDALL